MVQQFFLGGGGGELHCSHQPPLLISSLGLVEHIPIATPYPFLVIEYSASNSEETLSISFTKATFINWNPETIAAIQLALKSFCHQTGSVERVFELRGGDYDNEGDENDDFFDANEVLDETVSIFDKKSTPSTFHSGFDDFTYEQTFSLLILPSLTMDLATPRGLHIDTALSGCSNQKT